jgi:F420-dependent oxidoreductase-like protein
MKIAIGLGQSFNDDWHALADYVAGAERLGVDSVWSIETWTYDAATPLAYIAARTERIKLGTGIMQIDARTPAMVAMTANTLASMSGGRFILGLGVSGPQVMEGWHGIPFARPLQRTSETVEIIRKALSGERVVHEGDIYRLPRPGGEGKALSIGPRPAKPIPIYLATLGPKNLELTGELADGWIGTSFIPEHADNFFTHIAAGAARAGRSLADIDLGVGAGSVAFVTDESAMPRLLAARKPPLAFYIGAMGSARHNFYNDAWRRAGYTEMAREVQRLWLGGQRAEATALIPDDLAFKSNLDEATALIPDDLAFKSNLIGTEDQVRERLRLYRDVGINTLRISPEGATAEARLETLGRLVALVREVDAEVAPAAR